MRPAGSQPQEMVANWAQAFMGGNACLALHADGSCNGWIRDPDTIENNTVVMVFDGLGTWAVDGESVNFRWIIAEHGRKSDDKNNKNQTMAPMDAATQAQFEVAVKAGVKRITWGGQSVNKFEWH